MTLGDVATSRVSAEATIHELLDRAADATPDACAVAATDLRLSYGRLAELSHAGAGYLIDHGVRHGDRVLVQAWNNVATCVLLFAAARIGAVLVPVSPEMRPFQLRQVYHDAEPSLLLGDRDCVAQLRQAVSEPVALLEECRDELQRRSVAPVVRPVAPADLALLIYTSGTTSAPKAVMSPHRQVTFAARAIAERLAYRPDDSVFLRLPMSFDYGLYQLLLTTLSGSALYLADQRNDVGVLRELTASGCTVVPLVPTLGLMLNQLAMRRPTPCRVRLFTNTGAVLPPATISGLRRNFPGAAIVLMYGITECKRISIADPDGDLVDPLSLGPPLPGTEVFIVDQDGRRLGPNTSGQIVVRGRHVMPGYWRAEALTRQRFGVEDGVPVLYTGDYGRLSETGHIYFEGRRDDILKRRGTRISTLEIEAAALDCPGVRAAAVVVQPASSADRLVLFVTGEVDVATATREIADRLEPAKRPDRLVVLDTLPQQLNGKIDRRALAASAVTNELVG
jgi:acyl-CoA synthetase (AMP-forming)/AMP-acid ligase II